MADLRPKHHTPSEWMARRNEQGVVHAVDADAQERGMRWRGRGPNHSRLTVATVPSVLGSNASRGRAAKPP